MAEWSVEIDAESSRPADQALADLLVDSLAEYGPAVSVGAGGFSIRFNVVAPDRTAASVAAKEALLRVLPDVRVIRVEPETVEALERRLSSHG